MVTSDDKEFSILVSCSRNVPVRKMPYLMYLFQQAGMSLGYRYSIRLDTIKSYGLIATLGEVIARGYVTQHNEITKSGEQRLVQHYITYAQDILIDNILNYIDIFDLSQLYLLCISDITLQGVLQDGGYTSLRSRKQEVIDTIRGLCKGFTMDDFNTCIGIMQSIRNNKL